MDKNVKITIEGEGLSLTKNTTLQKAGQIISFLGYDQDNQIFSKESSSNGVGPALLPTNRLQPKEIIINSNAKTYAQKIVALAVYFKQQMEQSVFTPQELKVLFKKMGDEPKNFTRDLKTALESQYIHCVDQISEQYELTNKGEDALRDGFIGSVSRKSFNSKKIANPANVRDEIKNLEITGALDGFPDYYKLDTKGDKILWLLQYAFNKNLKTLTPTEVDFLSGKLLERIDSSGFTALNTKNIKNSFIIKTSGGFQIQKRGSDYLTKLNMKEKED